MSEVGWRIIQKITQTIHFELSQEDDGNLAFTTDITLHLPSTPLVLDKFY